MPDPDPVADPWGRPLAQLRLSVTDRCNLRCRYCMPEPEYRWLPRRDILTFEELERLVHVFAGLGVGKVRFTGGEPLLRRDLPQLVARIAAVPGIHHVALTTNGVHLARLGEELFQAGLRHLTVSLDTLDRARFHALTARDEHDAVLAGIEAARGVPFASRKLDAVVVRGRNDDEVLDLLAFAHDRGFELRFIEYMDVGGATGWRAEDVVGRAELLARIAARWGEPAPLPGRGSAPAERFRLPDGTTFGIVASTTTPFCGACDRSRLTADGHLLTCLYATTGLDLRAPLRAGASAAELARTIRTVWLERRDRGAEERLALHERQRLHSQEVLRDRPHLEMHTRGG